MMSPLKISDAIVCCVYYKTFFYYLNAKKNNSCKILVSYKPNVFNKYVITFPNLKIGKYINYTEKAVASSIFIKPKH